MDTDYQACKDAGEKLVLHICLTETDADPPASIAPTDSVWVLASQTAPTLSEQDRITMQEGVLEMRHAVQKADEMLTRGSSNLLITAMKQEIAVYEDLEKKTRCLLEVSPDLGAEAQSLIKSMNKAFDMGMMELATTRRTVVTIKMLGEQLSKAFLQGNLQDAQRYMKKMGSFVEVMDASTKDFTQKLNVVQTDFHTKLIEYKKKEKGYAFKQTASGGVAVVSGITGVGAGGAIATSWCSWVAEIGITRACTSLYLTPLGWNFAAGFGVGILGSVIFGKLKEQYRDAKESAAGFAGVAEIASDACTTQQRLWDGTGRNLTNVAKAFQNMNTMGADDQILFAGMFGDFAKAVAGLIRSLDEYLVFIAEKQFFPVTFAIRGSIIDQKVYDEIKVQMALEAVSP